MTIAATGMTIGATTVRTGMMIDATAGTIGATTDNQAITENSETPAFGPAFSLHGAAPASFSPSSFELPFLTYALRVSVQAG